uniref:DUF753 domain-containing protein n=1 Tax=Anopheles melas TaxID=34690 RepID=A0A182TWG1_9DIPT
MMRKVDSSGVWRVGRPMILGVMVLLVLVIPMVKGEVLCYSCQGCDEHDVMQTEQCSVECGIWYSSNGGVPTVNRGCIEQVQEDDVIYDQCETELCNTASVVRCVRCPTALTAECENVICPTSADQCYLNPAGSSRQTHRGCVSDEFPTTEFDSYDLCSDSTCNSHIFPNHLRCYQCDGCDAQISDADVNYCRNDQATGCFMLLVEFESGSKTVIRGCDTDPAFADCKINRNCETCTGDACNRAPQTAARLCYQCEGVEDCDRQTLATGCQNTAFTNQCYLYSDGAAGEELKKGCLLDLDETMAAACYDPTDTRCSICKDIQCNQQHCVRCNTQTEDVACLLGDKSAPGLQYALCEGNCRVEIDADGHTVRGCAEDFPEPCGQGDDARCLETVQAGSNGGIFPANRRQCYQCEGDSCWTMPEPGTARYCQLFRGSNDGCYIYNDGSTIVRGCTTDPGAKCLTEDGFDDQYCSIWMEDLRNDATQQREPLTCYQDCSGSESGQIPTCPPVTCPPTTDRCFVSVSVSGVISRGCTSFDCPPDSRDCYTCKEANCNGAYSVCSKCDTSIDGDCTVGTEHGEVCEQSEGCFQYQGDDGKGIYGCAEEAPAICSNDADHCNFCQDTFCNAKGPILCFSCTDCRDVATPIFQKTKLCGTEGDSCITALIDGRIDRDCRSDLPHPIEEYTVIEDCDTSNCNRLSITDWTSCYVCTGCNDVLGAEVTTELCLNPPTDTCFTKREDDGVIVRGCATEDGLVGCDNGLNCDVCAGENCNDRAIAQEFSCVQCDLSEDCAQYNVLSECPNTLGLLVDSCVTYTKQPDGVQKGCISTPDLYALCYGTSNDVCVVSEESMGNARPVQCIDCIESVECIRGEANELITNSYHHGSCVSFLDERGTVVRGNIVNYPEFQNAPHYKECFEDGCNKGLFPEDRLLCYQCSGEECARLTQSGSSITPQPCLRYDKANAKCYTWYESASNAQRGCLLDDGDDSLCGGEGVQSCKTCSDSRCNELDYAAFSETNVCVKCTTNRGCQQDLAEEACTDGGGCYTFFSGSLVVAKGCVSELAESMEWYEECAHGSGSERCQQCYGDYCNRNKCYACNSGLGSATDCLEPRLGLTESATCKTDDGCVAFIDANGHTVRGCRDSFDDPIAECSEQNAATCQLCNGDHCNGALLGKDRIKCYQCSGTAGCLEPAPNSALYCAIYREGEESCYTYFQDERTVERGCTLQRPEACEHPCQKCNTTACNDQRATMTNPLRCAQCSGDECPDINATDPTEVKPCTEGLLFGRTDQCYTYFDSADGSVQQRGCLSDLAKSAGGSAIAAQCLDATDGSCKLCTDDGCNARSVTCFVCNTDSDPDCADLLTESSAYRQACGTGRCVSLLDGATTRKGCLEDFNEVDCALKGTCQIFEGTLSNSAIYPADRIRCYQCSGSGCDEVQSSTSSSTCQQYDPDDECYTYVTDTGETFRGCLSDTQTPDPCADRSDVCVKCSSEAGCNTEPAQRSNDLVCAQCYNAVECGRTERYERCTKPVLLGRQDSCYVQSFDGELLARGCLSDAVGSLRDKCTAGGSNSECSVCLCDRCNGPPVECVSCEGEVGCGDVLGVGQSVVPCQTGSCVSLVKQLPNGATIIAKGCSEAYEQDTCRPANNASYQLCYSPGCNDVLFPPGRLKCFQCQGAGCSDPSLVPTICEPYSANDKCYSFLDRQQKGCVGQLQDLAECNPADGRCLVCDSSDGCNDEPRPLECIDCSSRTDPSCVEPIATFVKKKFCPIGGCVTFIDAHGFTVRGCAMEYYLTPASCTGTTCQLCTDDDNCNSMLLPQNRLQCYQCSGSSCLDVSNQTPSICQQYSADDVCYAYASSSTNIRRGCLSDLTSECPTDGCVTCATGNGCNAYPPVVANPLTCHHCDGVNCADEQTGTGAVCPAVLLGRTDACYSWVEKYTVRRGCLSDADACNAMNPNCYICTDGRDCNAERYAVERHECVQCDELPTDERCNWGFDRSAAEQCSSDTQQSSELGCYSCYISTLDPTERRLFHRGCVGEERQAQCEPGTVQVCLGAGCNHRNERLQICAKCEDVDGCESGRWVVEECRGVVPYDRRGCYLMRDARKRVTARGCAADLNDETWQLCSNVRDSSCLTCLGNECNHATTGTELVAIAIGQVTGPFITISARLCLILMNRRLNSSPQPFDSRKSHRILPSISTMFALKISCSFRRSIVDIPSFSSTADNRFSVSSQRVDTKKRVMRRTRRWNGFCCCCCVPTLCVGLSCVHRIRSSSMVGCEKQNPFRASIASSTPFISVCTVIGTGCEWHMREMESSSGLEMS